MKLFFEETVVKVRFSVAGRPLPSLALATSLYFVPRSSCFDGFQEEPSAAIEPLTSAPLSACTSFTSVSLPPLTWTPVSLMLALVAPSFEVTEIFASEASLAAAASAPAAWSLPSLPPAEASPPQADRARAPAARREAAASPRRSRRVRDGAGGAVLSGIVTGCSMQGCCESVLVNSNYGRVWLHSRRWCDERHARGGRGASGGPDSQARRGSPCSSSAGGAHGAATGVADSRSGLRT